MLTQAPAAESHTVRAANPKPLVWRLPMIEPTVTYRAKEEFEPTSPLPRWAGWTLIAWTIGTSAAYTAILARWWE